MAVFCSSILKPIFNVTCNKNGDESLYINDTFFSLIKDLKRELRFLNLASYLSRNFESLFTQFLKSKFLPTK